MLALGNLSKKTNRSESISPETMDINTQLSSSFQFIRSELKLKLTVNASR